MADRPPLVRPKQYLPSETTLRLKKLLNAKPKTNKTKKSACSSRNRIPEPATTKKKAVAPKTVVETKRKNDLQPTQRSSRPTSVVIRPPPPPSFSRPNAPPPERPSDAMGTQSTTLPRKRSSENAASNGSATSLLLGGAVKRPCREERGARLYDTCKLLAASTTTSSTASVEPTSKTATEHSEGSDRSIETAVPPMNCIAQNSLQKTSKNAASADFPRFQDTTDPKPAPLKIKANHVRLNLRNTAGSCRFHKKKKPRRFAPTTESSNSWSAAATLDPVDDYIDGRTPTQPNICRCRQPCTQRTVRKAGPNKGRKFYSCSLCNYFAWADTALMTTTTTGTSGFVARHVEAFRERTAGYTVPDLRKLAERYGLDPRGKKGVLSTRLAVWVRDEVMRGLENGGNNVTKEDLSSSSNSLESEEEVDSMSESGEDEGEGFSRVDPVSTGVDLQIGNQTENQTFPSLSSVGDSEKFVEFEDSDDDDDETCIGIESRSAFKTTSEPIEVVSEPTSVLRSLFGHKAFRSGQEWAVSRCLSQQRSLLVAPTGSGKSLCYALPAAMTKGICVVVSPLLSLINDQIQQLPVRLASATLSGPLSAARTTATVDDIVQGRIKILFVSPERLTSAAFRRLLRSQQTKLPPVSVLCVDEAHTLSQVGKRTVPDDWTHSLFTSGPTTSVHPIYVYGRSFN